MFRAQLVLGVSFRVRSRRAPWILCIRLKGSVQARKSLRGFHLTLLLVTDLQRGRISAVSKSVESVRLSALLYLEVTAKPSIFQRRVVGSTPGISIKKSEVTAAR